MKKLSIILVFISLLFQTVVAQKWSVGLNIFYDETLQDYNDNLDSNPIGLSMVGLYSLKNSRLSVGTDIGIAMYYSSTYTEDLTEKGHSGAYAEVYEEDCYYTYNAIARYNLSNAGPLTPYAEFKIGGASYFTSKDYSQFSGSNQPREIASDINVHGTSLKTGLGGGVIVNLGILRTGQKRSKFSLDLGATVNNGTKTNYRSVRNSETARLDSDSNYRSKTNNIIYRFGALFTF